MSVKALPHGRRGRGNGSSQRRHLNAAASLAELARRLRKAPGTIKVSVNEHE
jgi:hypothetical protein